MKEHTYFYDVIVVGTGAAGYSAACRVKQSGKKSVAIVTEDVCCGTSRNTGSDKQTYYKLGLGGDSADSIGRMAEDLFRCGSMDGDNALCEAALSARCFYYLCELGVEFPVNRYGEYVGYKTDHDPCARATSVGPLTSKFMTEALQKNAERLGIQVYDGMLAVEILKEDLGEMDGTGKNGRVCGLICLEKTGGSFHVFFCESIILATGGPAGIYADSVYPECHTGTSSLALLAGAKLQNLTEWQYGLASVDPRWNVSGTYMQVLPRFVSVDAEGREREFLLDYFDDPYRALSMVFLKGYQWPFDSRKAMGGSSVIDLLVYRESVLYGRSVFLDYTRNPFGLDEIPYDRLSQEALAYLEKAGACFGTPIERLLRMNAPAVELYADKGLDLRTSYLPIALCAQHSNGGIAVDLWWQTSVEGLFAAGECAGTHGVTRPGGSALNAGQVGALRAAELACAVKRELRPREEVSNSDAGRNSGIEEYRHLYELAEKTLQKHLDFCRKMLENDNNVTEIIAETQRRMSDSGGAIREHERMCCARKAVEELLGSFAKTVGVAGTEQLYWAYKLKDILIMQAAVLTAMIDFGEKTSGTRGSALYCDGRGEKDPKLEEVFRFSLEEGASLGRIQEILRAEKGFEIAWRDVRPIPEREDFFENVWRQYRENRNVY